MNFISNFRKSNCFWLNHLAWAKTRLSVEKFCIVWLVAATVMANLIMIDGTCTWTKSGISEIFYHHVMTSSFFPFHMNKKVSPYGMQNCAKFGQDQSVHFPNIAFKRLCYYILLWLNLKLMRRSSHHSLNKCL